MAKTAKLKRVIGLPLLTLYGLGNILGAGVYVLIGQVAGAAGYAAPLSFAIAFLVAAFTAFSYMELSSRYPTTASVSVYLYQAFRIPGLSALIGLILVGAGTVSAATLVKGFVGYFSSFSNAPSELVIVAVVVALSIVALTGISQSAKLAALFTVVEVVGLLLVIFVGLPHFSEASPLSLIRYSDLFSPGVLIGAFIAFYAFIGFEDMIEVVEEVKSPLTTMPKAILLSLVVSTVLYVLVLFSSLAVLSPQQLSSSSAPLVDVFSSASGQSPLILAAIGLAAIINGILVQIIMGSRILYGLASQGWIHGSFAQVHKQARTPIFSTSIVAALVIFLALYFPLIKLAELTSLLVLIVFVMVNLALLVVKKRGRLRTSHHEVPMFVPALGIVLTVSMMAAALLT